MTQEQFKQEERFIVIKRKHLSNEQERKLREGMRSLCIGTVECVVVESDWPEYETVWRMIEARCAGRPLSLAALKGEGREGVIEECAKVAEGHRYGDSFLDTCGMRREHRAHIAAAIRTLKTPPQDTGGE